MNFKLNRQTNWPERSAYWPLNQSGRYLRWHLTITLTSYFVDKRLKVENFFNLKRIKISSIKKLIGIIYKNFVCYQGYRDRLSYHWLWFRVSFIQLTMCQVSLTLANDIYVYIYPTTTQLLGLKRRWLHLLQSIKPPPQTKKCVLSMILNCMLNFQISRTLLGILANLNKFFFLDGLNSSFWFPAIPVSFPIH